MAKHIQKQNRKKQIIIALAIFAALGLIAALLTGALYANHERAPDQGAVLPEDAVLQDHNHLIPLENGGFVVISGNESETRLVFLNRDGTLAEAGTGYHSLPHLAERVFVCDGTLYIAGGFQSIGAEWITGGITRLPLRSTNAAELETVTFDQSLDSVDVRFLCADTFGYLYAIDFMENSVIRFAPDRMEAWETITFPFSDDTILEGLAIRDTTVYINGYSSAEGPQLWKGTLFSGTITDLQKLPEAELFFPLKFLSDDLVLDDVGNLYSLTETGFFRESDAPYFYDAVLDSNGDLFGISETGRIDLFAPGNYSAPVDSFDGNGEITAMAYHGGIAILVYDGNSYRYLLLDVSDFDQSTESTVSSENPVDSEPVSSADSSAASSSAETSEPDIPIYSEPEDSSLWSSDPDGDDSNSGGTSSGGDGGTSSEEYPMAEKITSTEFSVDRSANVVYLPEGTTVSRFRSTVPLHGATLSAYQYNGGILQSGVLGTGMTLRLFNGETEKDRITVIVLGDLNGTGTVNSADERLLYQHLTEEQPLTGYFYSAADMDQDNTVDTRDLLLLKQQLSH